MGDDASKIPPTQAQGKPSRRDAPDAGWEERALARVNAHVEQLSKDLRKLPDGWETDTVTRLEDYFGHKDD